MSKKITSFKIMLLGDSSVGKRTFILQFCEEKLGEDSLNSVGIDMKVKYIFHKGKKIKLEIYDKAGLERFGSISKNIYNEADGILLMYDVSKKDTFRHVKSCIQNIQYNEGDDMDKKP